MAVYSPKKHSANGEESVLFPIESIDKLSDSLDTKLYGLNIVADDDTTCEEIINTFPKDNAHTDQVLVYVKYNNKDYYLLFRLAESAGGGLFTITDVPSGKSYSTGSSYNNLASYKISTIIASIENSQSYISRINDLKSAITDKQSITDNGLSTSEKTIVGAINEVRATANRALAAVSSGSGEGGVSDIANVDLAVEYSDSINNLSFDDEGIYYAGQYQMTDSSNKILSSGELQNNIPIVAGAGISFTDTGENTISINATDSKDSSTAMPTIKLLTVRDKLNTNVLNDENMFVFTFEISNPELLEDGDTIQICARKRGWKYNKPNATSKIRVKTYKYRLRNFYETKVMTQEIADTYNLSPNVTFQYLYENPTRAILRFNVPCAVNNVKTLLHHSHHAHELPLTNIYFRLCRKQYAENAALHSNVVSIQKYTYYDETNGVYIIHFNY